MVDEQGSQILYIFTARFTVASPNQQLGSKGLLKVIGLLLGGVVVHQLTAL